jgi:Leucine-rich repeat (LRR) protein
LIDRYSSKERKVTDSFFVLFEASKNLQLLDLSGCKNITPKGIVHIDKLKKLTLDHAQFSPNWSAEAFRSKCKELQNEPFKSIQEVSLRHSQISDEFLSLLENSKHLKYLDVTGCESSAMSRRGICSSPVQWVSEGEYTPSVG